ncbi:MAG: hypothetical protein SGPRY_000031 [Prymnesium sp.]
MGGLSIPPPFTTGLERAGEGTVDQWIDSLSSGGEDNRYLFDWSLPQNAPELLSGSGEDSGFVVPRYFCNDFLQRAPVGSLYRESWPSLFVGPSGSSCSVHIDTFGSHFWMMLLEAAGRPDVRAELSVAALRNEEAAKLLQHLSAPDFDTEMYFEEVDLPWCEFKSPPHVTAPRL